MFDMYEDARNRAVQLKMNHALWHPKPRNNYEKLCKKIPTAFIERLPGQGRIKFLSGF